MPRFRFTIRRMIVAVAIVGVALGLERMRHRSRVFRAFATTYAASHAASKLEAESDAATAQQFKYYGFLEGEESFTIQEALNRERASFFDRMATKYRRAARYPWLTVAPDPREPGSVSPAHSSHAPVGATTAY